MPLEIEYRIGSDYPVLSAYMQSRAPVSLIRGPRASGKTFGSAQRCLMHMCEQEPNERGVRHTRGLVTRDSYAELSNTTIKDFMDVMRDLVDFKSGATGTPTAVTKPGLRLADGTLLDGEVIFQSSGVDDAAERAKGFQLTYAWFNEASGTDLDFFGRVREALGRYPSMAAGGVACTWRGLFGDTNSFDESHWLFPIFQSPPAGWAVFSQPGGVLDSGRTDANGRKVWLPNPNAENLCWLAPRYYEELVAGGKDDDIKVLLANEYGFRVDGKPVHPEYIDSVHCAPAEFEPNERYPLILGVDFGRTPAASFTQYWEREGRWVVVDEFCSYDMSASIFAPELKRYIERRYPKFTVRAYGDPAGSQGGQQVEDTCLRIMRAAGIPITEAPDNQPDLRRAAIAGPCTRLCLDGRPAFLLSPRAKNTRKGLAGGWAYRKLRVAGREEYNEKPDKGPLSHICEACEYALYGGGEGAKALRPASPHGEHERPMWAETNW